MSAGSDCLLCVGPQRKPITDQASDVPCTDDPSALVYYVAEGSVSYSTCLVN